MITTNHMFWFALSMIVLITLIGIDSSIENSPFAIFAFIVIFLLVQAKRNGEIDLGMLAVNGSLVCLSFLAFDKGVFDYLLWSVIVLALLSVPVAHWTNYCMGE